MMKVAHFSDLHYCPKHLAYVDQAFTAAVDDAIARGCDAAIISGDSFDSSMGIHEPAVTAYLQQLTRLGNAMPTAVLQGTQSHDRLGSLDIVKELGELTRFSIWVADEVGSMALYRHAHCGDGCGLFWSDEEELISPVMLVRALPSLNKADPDVMKKGAAEWVENKLTLLAGQNARCRTLGVPSILVTHGTVTGCSTESNFAMVSPDHEFSIETLLLADCDAVMLGHIHKHQSWDGVTPSGAPCTIAYAGSISRLVHGHSDETGYLVWDIEAGRTSFEFVPVPGRQLIDITFPGTPDMSELADMSALVTAIDHVRIRWSVDKEHAHTIDKEAIRSLFVHCAGLKLEGTVNHIQSVRAGGISRAVTLDSKIGLWAATTGDTEAVPALCDRVEMLKSMDTDQIVRQIIGQNEAA